MTQTEARARAKALSTERCQLYVATTVCSQRGEFEEGPDAGQWVVAEALGATVEGP
jgi:hypothetical protein